MTFRCLSAAALAMGLALAGAAPALAGDVEDTAREAERRLAAGKHLEAIELLRTALADLVAKTPLGFRKAVLVGQPQSGFGMYTPRKDNVFASGEPIHTYVEPIGLAWRRHAETFEAVFTVDIEIRTPDGKVLGGQKEFGRFEFVSRERNHEVMTNLTLTLTGVAPGDYIFGATFNDRIGGRSATLDMPFVIR